MGIQKEIIISGVGGQGLILSGTLLGEAAVVYDKKQATLSSEYGVETRGTFTKSDLIVSDEDIYYTESTKPDLIICLAPVAYERYSGKTENGAFLIYDSDQIDAVTINNDLERGIHITQIAKSLGNNSLVNIVATGIIAGKMNVSTVESIKAVLAVYFGKRGSDVLDMYCQAFDKGYEIGITL